MNGSEDDLEYGDPELEDEDDDDVCEHGVSFSEECEYCEDDEDDYDIDEDDE